MVSPNIMMAPGTESTLSRDHYHAPLFVGLLLAIGLLACDTAGPSARTGPEASPVSLSVSAGGGDAPGSAQAAATSGLPETTVTDSNGNSLRLNRVELILQSIAFERADDDCASGDDDRCEELVGGPIRVSLPLGTDSPSVVVDTTLPVGTWEEATFEVGETSDSSILAETNFPSDASIRAEGTFSPAGGSAQGFTYVSDLGAERELEFEPPLEVAKNEPTNVTFSVDLNAWFRRSNGTLVDPAEAVEGRRFADLVEENIESSIEGFEDDDFDGENDHEQDENEDDEDETEIEVDLENNGPDPDASGDAEYEQESDKREFSVEVEDLDVGTYQVVVDDTVRGEVEVISEEDGTEGEVEFRDPSEPGHPALEFDPRGTRVAIVQNGTTFLAADMPTQSNDDDGDDDGDKDREIEIEVDLKNTGTAPDASGEAEFEQEGDRRTFEVEIEDVSPGIYDVVVADTTRGQIEISEDDDGEGEIEFRTPSVSGHPPLTFDPRGSRVAVDMDDVTYLEVNFPSKGDD